MALCKPNPDSTQTVNLVCRSCFLVSGMQEESQKHRWLLEPALSFLYFTHEIVARTSRGRFGNPQKRRGNTRRRRPWCSRRVASAMQIRVAELLVQRRLTCPKTILVQTLVLCLVTCYPCEISVLASPLHYEPTAKCKAGVHTVPTRLVELLQV